MKLGIHAYAWCSQWSNDTLYLIDKVKNFDLDFIEIPLMCLDTFDGQAIRKKLDSAGLTAVTSTVLPGDADITSDHKRTRESGLSYLKKCVDATAEIGAKSFSGVIYSQHVKQTTKAPTEDAWKWSAEILAKVAAHARQYAIQIGLEPVNRYETCLINTCQQALKLIEMAGSENMKVHLDTYHMNIEEKDFYEPTKLAGDKLIHYHLCENDRGIPGTGLVNWDEIFRALSEMNYQGYAALESFIDTTDNMNTWVWRKLAENSDTLLTEGVAFIKGMQKKYNLI